MLVACTTAVSLASYGAYAWTAKRAFPELRIRLSAFNPTLVREVTSFSSYLFVISIGIQIGFNIDNLVIGAMLGTSAVAIYAVAFRLADYQRQLCNQFQGLLFPVVIRFGTAGRTDALRDMLIEGTRVALALVIGVTVCVIGFASPLIARWMGPGFDGSVAPLYVLAATGIVLVGQGPLGTILLGTGRHRFVALVVLVEALANLALSLALVRRYGIVGVALGTAVPVLITNLFFLMPAACRQVGLSVATFGRLVAMAPMAGALPAAAVLVVLRSAVPPHSLAVIFGEAMVVGVVYLLAFLAALDRSVRTRYFTFLSQLLASPSPGVAASSPMTEP
jgi:O-antigen/teichoic acid export membrane protein